MSTLENWEMGPNQAAVDYLTGLGLPGKVYVSGGVGVPDVVSQNNVLGVNFY